MPLSGSDRVRVIAGPYTGWEGRVVRISEDAKGVTVELQVFGRRELISLRDTEVVPIPLSR